MLDIYFDMWYNTPIDEASHVEVLPAQALALEHGL